MKSLNLMLGVLVIALSSAMSGHAAATDSYTIRVVPGESPVLRIDARLNLRGSILKMDEHGADHLPDRWATFVRNLAALDKRGKQITVTKLADAQWRLAAKPGDEIKLSYEIALDHEKHDWAGGVDGVSFVRDWGVFATGRTFLIMNGEHRTATSVAFELPNDWTVTTGWKPVAGKPHHFVARDTDDLLESMFTAGTHSSFSVRRNGFELVFALAGPGLASKKAEYEKFAQGALDYYVDLMGGIPNPPPGKKFDRSAVIINAGKAMDGEVIGNHISMIFDPEGDAGSRLIADFIFAHEFFHLWNGKSINVASTKEDWFKEGVTNYYSMKALHHLGKITERQFFDTLSDLFYARYAADIGYGKQSMRDVAAGMNKDKHWGLIYGGGMFAGMCQDIEIRKRSSNRRSLDDLMREYYRQYAGTDKTYTTDDLRAKLTTIAGADQTDFFRRHVIGVESVPIADCLKTAGLDVAVKDGKLVVGRPAGSGRIPIVEGILGK